MKTLVPVMVTDLTENVQFRSTVHGEEGKEILDCRFWFKSPTGEWIPSSDAVQVHCNRLMALQRQYWVAVQEAVARGEAALRVIQESFNAEIEQAQMISDSSIREYHLITELVDQALESLAKEHNEGVEFN